MGSEVLGSIGLCGSGTGLLVSGSTLNFPTPLHILHPTGLPCLLHIPVPVQDGQFLVFGYGQSFFQ